jgi:HEPN domain-containing protein
MPSAVSPSPPPNEHRAYAQLLLRKAQSHRIVLAHVGLDPTFADMIVGFHAQQAIEKLIKAVLSHNQIAYPRVNDLDRLLHLLEAEVSAAVSQAPGARLYIGLNLRAQRC